MAGGIGEVALRLGRRCAISLSRQATARHRIKRQGPQIAWLHASVLGRLDGLLHGSFGLGDRRRRFPVQLGLLSGWRIRLLCILRLSV